MISVWRLVVGRRRNDGSVFVAEKGLSDSDTEKFNYGVK